VCVKHRSVLPISPEKLPVQTLVEDKVTDDGQSSSLNSNQDWSGQHLFFYIEFYLAPPNPCSLRWFGSALRLQQGWTQHRPGSYYSSSRYMRPSPMQSPENKKVSIQTAELKGGLEKRASETSRGRRSATI